MFRFRRKNNAAIGFTMIEIIVVLIVIAIAAAMVIPMVLSTADLEATSGARMLLSDLQYAQNVAITSQTPVTVTFDVSADSYSLTNTSGTLIHPISKSAYEVDFTAMRGFDRLEIVSAGFGGNASVTFDALGTPDNAGSVTLQAGPHIYRVDVAAATGKVTVTSIGL
ncbi:MAG: GspH/FimT family protein [Planctomycetota bacterium]|nr:GspH/FimT family protein [Planctomycetota bacterium]